MKRIAVRETMNEAARQNYTYRQIVVIEEYDRRGARAGTYREVRDIIFSPRGRTEQFIEGPENRLKRLQLTPEDFRDLREVQPFLLTLEQLRWYEGKYKGEEEIDGVDCFVVAVRPRQILSEQRLFDGMLWVDKRDFAIVRLEGKAVPEILTLKSENLFPRFTTIRHQVDGQHWFPLHTYADDVLPFRSEPLRMKMIVRYSNYKRFSAESSITFEKP
jgi:hypothetical protein